MQLGVASVFEHEVLVFWARRQKAVEIRRSILATLISAVLFE